MTIGWNFITGQHQYLTSWKSASDPSLGDLTYGLDIVGLPQAVGCKGSEKRFRTGTWNGLGFSGVTMNHAFTLVFVTNADETYFMFSLTNSVISRVVLNQSGWVERHALSEGGSEWVVMYRMPNNMCEDYGTCGPNGICRLKGNPTCDCLKGYVPQKQREWDVLIWSGGCVRSTPLNCEEGDGFIKVKNVKLPDLVRFSLNKSMNLEECKAECLKNCSCVALANSDIRDGGS